MPRSVPFRLLKETLHSTKRVHNPCAANSASEKVQAKKPRSSSNFSRSITKAPTNLVSLKIIGRRSRGGRHFQLNAQGFDNFDLRKRDDEPSAPAAISVLLFQDFFGKVPGQQQYVIRHVFQQMLRRKNAELGTRRVVALLSSAAIDHISEHLLTKSKTIQQSAAFGRCAIDCDPLAALLQLAQ